MGVKTINLEKATSLDRARDGSWWFKELSGFPVLLVPLRVISPSEQSKKVGDTRKLPHGPDTADV